MCSVLKHVSKSLTSFKCCGSGMFIPDPNFSHLDRGSRVEKIPDPGSRSVPREFIVVTEFFLLSFRKYDPGCSFWIRILILYPSRIPDPGVKKAPDPGSGSATLLLLLLSSTPFHNRTFTEKYQGLM